MCNFWVFFVLNELSFYFFSRSFISFSRYFRVWSLVTSGQWLVFRGSFAW